MEAGEYAAAFWLSAQCRRALDALASLAVCADLAATVEDTYAAALLQLDRALQASCANFQPDAYAKVG